MAQKVQGDTNKKHNEGHRARLRRRLLNSGPDALQDYELLELILTMAIPRRDVKPLAKDLLAHFGSLSAVLHADAGALRKFDGVGDTAAAAIKTVTAGAHHILQQDLSQRPVLNSWSRLLDYCKATMAHETREHFRILFLNKKNELMADEIQHSGTVDHTQAYPREIMKRALEVGATAMILIHNHPSGDATPSQPDIDLTKAIVNAAHPFKIVIHDHVIVARTETASMRNMGLMP
jgi:DNA repair protein RadC